MDYTESDYLIADGKNKKAKLEIRGIGCLKRRTIVVEPLIILYVIAALPMMTIRDQLMYQKVAESLGINLSNTTTENESRCDANSTDPHYIAKELVQRETATLSMYLSLLIFIPSFFGLLVYGALGDRFGRRPILILPCFGSLLQALLYICIIKFDLSVYFFFAEPVTYFFGNFNSIFMAAFAYISDIVPSEKLSFRMTIVDVVAIGNAAVANLFVGYWIKAQGFLWPMVFVAGGKVLALIYAVLFIPETVKNPNQGDGNQNKMRLKDFFTGLRLIYKDNGTGRCSKINLLLAALIIGSLISAYSILILFQLNDPLCWDSVYIGYFSSSSMLIKCLSMLFAAGVLKKYMSDQWLLFMALVSTCLQYTFLIFATNIIIMFIGEYMTSIDQSPFRYYE